VAVYEKYSLATKTLTAGAPVLDMEATGCVATRADEKRYD